MRITALSRGIRAPLPHGRGSGWLYLILCGVLFTPLRAASPDSRIVALASSLSQGDGYGALESFDKSMTDYSAVSRDLSALVAQAEVTCAIDIVEDKDADDQSAVVHRLDLDWYMRLKSRTDPNLVEYRRLRVAVTVHRGDWRIVSLAPEQILAPIAIK